MASHRVFINESVLIAILKRARWGFPNEVGGFLLGSLISSKNRTYEISDVVYGITPVGLPDRVEFTEECYARARRVANRKNISVIGYHHSHPYPRESYLLTLQSPSDAEIQELELMDLSLVLGITPDGFRFDIWLRGYSARMTTFISSNETPLDYKGVETFVRRRKNDSVWSSYLLP